MRRLAAWLWAGYSMSHGMITQAGEAWTETLHYGAYVDLSWANDLEGSGRVAWRSKATTQHLNQFDANLGMAYLRKDATAESPFGFELGGQGGNDTAGQVPASDRLKGYDVLRYVSAANVSYLVPVGNGLTLTGGLMNSFIGFESFRAKENPNYTRSWIADYSPYFLIGVGGKYPVRDDLAVSFFLVSDYSHLAHVNDQPKYAGQVTWKLNEAWSLTQNVFAGPEQADTALDYWRGFSDTILQWSKDDLLAALAYDIGTEKLAGTPDSTQALWMGSALFTRWHIDGPWSLALRPEVYWDPDGRMTGSRQFIKAVTTTVEYSLPVGRSSLAMRAEYRYDNSTGPGGGFFNPETGGMTLITGQSLFFLSGLWSYNGP